MKNPRITFDAKPTHQVLIWEYNIPVPIKYISEPDMHSMPATTLHPTGGFFVGQSLDNKIVTWTARDKFRQMRKKEFKGHVNAGYACRMSFSPNGKFLASGDGQGKMYIWDWGSTKVYRKLQVCYRLSYSHGAVEHLINTSFYGITPLHEISTVTKSDVFF